MGLKKVWIETYGCQMNKAESKAFQILFETSGWIISEKETDADIILLITCSVRNKAEERIWGRIGHFRHLKKNHNFKLIITGCMAERLKERIITRAKEVDIVIGNFQKHRLVEICDNSLKKKEPQTINHTAVYANKDRYSFYSLHGKKHFKAFVPIMHGCNNYCSYCIVPYVRGPEISRPPLEILEEISRLDKNNIKEITLLGQNVNSYSYSYNSANIDFTEICEKIIKSVNKIKWIRFLTSHPKDFPQKLISVIAENPSLCNHIHLPVQHGSDHILKKMNRGYRLYDYMKLVEFIKKKINDIALTTDILIGFPGETEKDFQATLTLMNEIEFDDAFIYRFSRREGTKAASFCDTVPEELKLDRLSQIIDLQRKISKKKKENKIGKITDVLIESISKKEKKELLGRTEHDEMVVFSGNPDKIGSFTRVRLVSLCGNTFKGKDLLCPGN